MMRLSKIIFLTMTFFGIFSISAMDDAVANAEHFAQTGLPLPRYVSLRTNEVNVRTGPGVKYPLEWVYVKKDLPVKVTAEFEHWRQIKDADGHEGWVHKVMLSGHRTVIIKDNQTEIYAKPDETSRKIAFLERSVIADFKGCDKGWCQVRAQNFKGWILKSSLWGVLDSE